MSSVNKKINISIPESNYIELNICKSNATGVGKNEQVSLEKKDNSLILISGRVGKRVGKDCQTTSVYTMPQPHIFHLVKDRAGKIFESDYERDEESLDELFESMVSNYIRKGYIITKTEKMDDLKYQKSNSYRPLEDNDIQEIIDYLKQFQDQYMEENYTVTLDNISDEMLTEANNLLKDLNQSKDNLSVAMFNVELHKLYAMIPRRIPNLKKYDVHKKSDFIKKLSDEQEMIDFLIELKKNRIDDVSTKQTILEAMQLKWRNVDIDEMLHIKKLMGTSKGKYIRAWRIENERTKKYMDNYCQKKNLTLENGGVKELFHGSKTENWFSIINNGLWLCPENNGVAICGKAFGHGIYFAPLAKKSIGYTSGFGSYWANGDQAKGYLAIFEVATGEIYDIYGEGNGVPDNYHELQEKHPGADCTWAFSRAKYSNAYLANEEVIVYTDGSVQEGSLKSEDEKLSQCTIKYLIEFDPSVGELD